MSELERLRDKRATWTLADDNKLISILGDLVDSIKERGDKFTQNIDSLKTTINSLHFVLESNHASIGLHSGTQFIEQRVAEDDYRRRQPNPQPPPISLQERQHLILREITDSVHEGLNTIKNNFMPLGDPDDSFIQYEPIDKYNRPIPPLIGSVEFKRMKKPKELEKSQTVSVPVPPPSLPPRASESVDNQDSVPPLPPRTIGNGATPTMFAPPPPVPEMPITRTKITVSIAESTNNKTGQFLVPHDDEDEISDGGLAPVVPKKDPVHASQRASEPIKETLKSIPLHKPVDLKKKSIFDSDSDDDDFAAVLARPSKKASVASSSTFSSSTRSIETESRGPSEEKKIDTKAAIPSLMSQLATAASKRVGEMGEKRNDDEIKSTKLSSTKNPLDQTKTIVQPVIPPRSTLPPNVTIKQKEVDDHPSTNQKDAVKKAPVISNAKETIEAKKSIFDDSDSDNDLFRPVASRKNPVVVKSEKQDHPPKKETVVPKMEVKKTVTVVTPKEEAQKVSPPKAVKKTEPMKKKNIFDSDSDFDDLFKPKTTPPPKKAALPTKKVEESRNAEEVSSIKAYPTSAPKAVTEPSVKEVKVDPLFAPKAVADPVVQENKVQEENLPTKADPLSVPKVVTEPTKSAVEEVQTVSTLTEEVEKIVHPVEEKKSVTSAESKEEEKVHHKDIDEVILPLPSESSTQDKEPLIRQESPLRESPPPFVKLSTSTPPPRPDKSSSSVSPSPSRTQDKSSSEPFDGPPPFNQVEEDSTDRFDNDSSSDSEKEPEMNNRAAFMQQLNAKLAAKPPSTVGAPRPFSMIETSSSPFVPPVVGKPAPITRRAESESRETVKKESPISHANKSRPRGPTRRPPTKKITSSSDSEDGLKTNVHPPSSSMQKSSSSSSSTKMPESDPPPPRKISDTKPAITPISRKSSSSSITNDADPLSSLSNVHISPYKAPPTSAAKPPVVPTQRVTIPAAASTSKPVTKEPSVDKKKKSIFDSDSDDFFDNLQQISRTLPAKLPVTRKEPASSEPMKDASSSKTASSSQKKSIFDDSDDELDLFRKK